MRISIQFTWNMLFFVHKCYCSRMWQAHTMSFNRVSIVFELMYIRYTHTFKKYSSIFHTILFFIQIACKMADKNNCLENICDPFISNSSRLSHKIPNYGNAMQLTFIDRNCIKTYRNKMANPDSFTQTVLFHLWSSSSYLFSAFLKRLYIECIQGSL